MIDWFTVSAQIINFLILVFLLKRFLYGPVIAAMNKREERISGRLREAREKSREAESERDEYRKKNEELESIRSDLVRKAKEEAEEEKKALLRDIRKETEEIRIKWRDTVQREKETFLLSLQERIAEQLCSVARKAFRDLAGAGLERQMISTFLEKLKEMDAPEQEKIKHALHEKGGDIDIASSFAVSEEDRGRINDVLGELTATDIKPVFTESKEVLCGIELRTEDFVIGWNLNEYLVSLEQNVCTALDSWSGRKDK